MVCTAPKRLLHTACTAEPPHIVAGERFHWSREERCFQRERFRCRAWFIPIFYSLWFILAAQHERFRCRAWFILAASARARRCTPQTEHNGGFGFQTKMKDRFLNQRRWTCWYSCRENMQVLSATDSLVLLFFLFSFWKACYLCCLPHVTVCRLSLIFYIIIYWFLSVC